MTNLTYDKAMLRRYWLGAASADEAERLDEATLTDDACALALESAENDLVDAYAGGSLSAAELAQFERHYLASPRRREKAQFAQALQRLPTLAPAPVATQTPVAEQSETSRGFWSFDWLLLPLWQAGFVMAAVALLVACLWLATENRRLRQQSESERLALVQREKELQAAATTNQEELARIRERLAQLEAQPQPSVPATQVFAFTLAAPLRGASDVPRLAVPAQATEVALKLALEAADYPRYRLRLRDPLTNRVIWQSGAVTATGDKKVKVRLPAKLLAAQRYAFEVSGVTPQGAEERFGNYPFVVSKP